MTTTANENAPNPSGAPTPNAQTEGNDRTKPLDKETNHLNQTTAPPVLDVGTAQDILNFIANSGVEAESIAPEELVALARTPRTNAFTVTNPSGRVIRPEDTDMATLVNGDQHAVGGSLIRAAHVIAAISTNEMDDEISSEVEKVSIRRQPTEFGGVDFIELSRLANEPWRVHFADSGDDYSPEDARVFAKDLLKACNAADDKNAENGTLPSPEVSRVEFDALHKAATSALCDFAGCSKSGHDFMTEPSEWLHDAERPFCDGLVKVIVIQEPDASHSAEIAMEATGTMTTDELRDMADLYTGFPSWLRARADELDALNGVAA